MTRYYANLQRGPFLMPIWLSAMGTLAVMCLLSFAVWVWVTADATTVIIVRHAEMEINAGGDPPLTPAGEARAELLARLFGDSRTVGVIDAIYVAATLRSRLTAAPLAARLGLMPIVAPAHDAHDLVRRMLREHPGGRILVVGPSDTVTAMVESLSGAEHLPAIAESDYGALYIVTVPRIGRANFLRLTY